MHQYTYSNISYVISISNEKPDSAFKLEIPFLAHTSFYEESEQAHEVAIDLILLNT